MKCHLWVVLFLIIFLTGCQHVDYEAIKTEIKQELEAELIASFEARNQVTETYNLEDFSHHIKSVATKIQSCTVGIEVQYSVGNPSVGSGVIFKNEENKYFVLSNEHVVRHHQTIFIYLFEYDEKIEAVIEKLDLEKDLAILSFEFDKLLNSCLIEQVEYGIGDLVFAVGSMVSLEYSNSVTIGIISACNEMRIQHDAAINVGSSGGPLFNLYGKLIGINVSKISNTSSTGSIVPVDGVGFSIPLEIIIEFINEGTD